MFGPGSSYPKLFTVVVAAVMLCLYLVIWNEDLFTGFSVPLIKPLKAFRSSHMEALDSEAIGRRFQEREKILIQNYSEAYEKKIPTSDFMDYNKEDIHSSYMEVLDSEAIGRRFQEREKIMLQKCSETHERKIPTTRYMYYNREHRLLVCVPAKAGSTTMKLHMLRLAGHPELKIHSSHSSRAIGRLSKQSAKNAKEILEAPWVTRVMVARHPLDRLASGYRGKLKDGRPTDFPWVLQYANTSGSKKVSATFQEFLEMIVYVNRKYGSSAINGHFRPSTLMCSPCAVHYQYVLHTDSLSEDFDHVVTRLNISLTNTELQKNNKTKVSYDDYYRNIPPRLMKEIYEIFKQDFRLHGFELPPFLKRKIA